VVKKPSWLRWSRENKPADAPAQDTKAVRQRTDQKIRQQDAQKQRQDEEAKKPRRGEGGKKDSR
jgi:hypothetical protein